jgi:hypothetical protein
VNQSVSNHKWTDQIRNIALLLYVEELESIGEDLFFSDFTSIRYKVHSQIEDSMDYSEIASKIATIHEIGQKRFDQCLDPTMKALHPAQIDWLEPSERAQLSELELELYQFSDSLTEIRHRVMMKRELRNRGIDISSTDTSLLEAICVEHGIDFEMLNWADHHKVHVDTDSSPDTDSGLDSQEYDPQLEALQEAEVVYHRQSKQPNKSGKVSLDLLGIGLDLDLDLD